jgi:hypothetical protein
VRPACLWAASYGDTQTTALATSAQSKSWWGVEISRENAVLPRMSCVLTAFVKLYGQVASSSFTTFVMLLPNLQTTLQPAPARSASVGESTFSPFTISATRSLPLGASMSLIMRYNYRCGGRAGIPRVILSADHNCVLSPILIIPVPAGLQGDHEGVASIAPYGNRPARLNLPIFIGDGECCGTAVHARQIVRHGSRNGYWDHLPVRRPQPRRIRCTGDRWWSLVDLDGS